MRELTCSDTLLDKYLDFVHDTEAFLININITINRASKDTLNNNEGFKLVDMCTKKQSLKL